jgi:hypothetical protein
MTFEESGLRFEFSPSQWYALLQYDETKDFLKIRDAVSKTKGVDFVGIFQNSTLVLMEVKNFRGSRIANKPRVEQGDDPLEIEFAQKVKDTIAGIAGGARNSTHFKTEWMSFLDLIKMKGNGWMRCFGWKKISRRQACPKSGRKQDGMFF